MTQSSRPAPTVEQFVGSYGPDFKPGVLAEHLEAFQRAGGIVRRATSGSGAMWALVPSGKAVKAYPVVCGDVVPVQTEDGIVTGRCGIIATREGACAGHAAEMDSWREMAEAERAAWERDRDGVPAIHFVD